MRISRRFGVIAAVIVVIGGGAGAYYAYQLQQEKPRGIKAGSRAPETKDDTASQNDSDKTKADSDKSGKQNENNSQTNSGQTTPKTLPGVSSQQSEAQQKDGQAVPQVGSDNSQMLSALLVCCLMAFLVVLTREQQKRLHQAINR